MRRLNKKLALNMTSLTRATVLVTTYLQSIFPLGRKSSIVRSQGRHFLLQQKLRETFQATFKYMYNSETTKYMHLNLKDNCHYKNIIELTETF